MINTIFSFLEKWGTITGLVTNIIQPPIWLIWHYYKERKSKKELEDTLRDKNYWNEEYYKMKDTANAWHQIAKEELSIMKHNAPEAYRKFVESYGGEDKFQEWWQLPDIPITEDKK